MLLLLKHLIELQQSTGLALVSGYPQTQGGAGLLSHHHGRGRYRNNGGGSHGRHQLPVAAQLPGDSSQERVLYLNHVSRLEGCLNTDPIKFNINK